MLGSFSAITRVDVVIRLRALPLPAGTTTAIFQVYPGMETFPLGWIREPEKLLGPHVISISLPDCARVRQ